MTAFIRMLSSASLCCHFHQIHLIRANHCQLVTLENLIMDICALYCMKVTLSFGPLEKKMKKIK